MYCNNCLCSKTLVEHLEIGGEKGSADTARDPRGFAVKFYTEDGNWDLVGNNTPIFFIRDPLLVTEIIVYTLCQQKRIIFPTSRISFSVSELHSHTEAQSEDELERCRHVLGLHLVATGNDASGVLPLLRPRHA